MKYIWKKVLQELFWALIPFKLYQNTSECHIVQQYWSLDSFYEVSFSQSIPYLYKFTIWPCIEYCYHVWANVPSCYLELLDKLQKRICKTVGPSLAASLEPLAHWRNVASLSLLNRYYFGRCSSELSQLVPLPYSRGTSTRYSDRLHDFSLTIPRCYKDVYVNIFFSRTAGLWNSLPIECFSLTYNLSGFKFRINRHLLTVGFF